MKIYNEIVIDMNPESSSYGKTLHEDSCHYTGDIMLCGGGTATTGRGTGGGGGGGSSTTTINLTDEGGSEISIPTSTEVICRSGEIKDEQSGLCVPLSFESIDAEGNEEIITNYGNWDPHPWHKEEEGISDEELQDYFDEYGRYPDSYYERSGEEAPITCPDGSVVPHASYCDDPGYDWQTPTEWFGQEDVDVPDWYDMPGGQDEFENYIYNYYAGQTNLNKEDWLEEYGSYFESFEDRPEFTEFVLKLKQIGLHEQGKDELHDMNILNLHKESLDYLDRINEATLKTGGKQLAWDMESGYKERGGAMGGRSIEAVKDIVATNNLALTNNLVKEHLDVDILKEDFDDKLYDWQDQQLDLEGQLAGIQTSYQTYLDSMFIANPGLGYASRKRHGGRTETEEEICDSMTSQTWCSATSECCLPNQLCSSEKGCYFPDNGGDGGGGGSLPQGPDTGLVIQK